MIIGVKVKEENKTKVKKALEYICISFPNLFTSAKYQLANNLSMISKVKVDVDDILYSGEVEDNKKENLIILDYQFTSFKFL